MYDFSQVLNDDDQYWIATSSGINALGPDEELHVKLTFAPSHLTKINILATVSTALSWLWALAADI